jgi:glucuronate isomerase
MVTFFEQNNSTEKHNGIKSFLNHDFLLDNDIAAALYHEHAALMPIIDYHNHLSPKDIAENRIFDNLTQVWLAGDHYKWRAMRTFGVPERFITGDASDWEKFEHWATTVPATMRNPLFHWTHLELQRYFGIHELLSPSTARDIYEQANECLQKSDFGARELLSRMNVEVVCTTDDPLDNLAWHQQYAAQGKNGPAMYPTFRPDKAILIEKTDFVTYIQQLAEVCGTTITSYFDLLDVLHRRMDFFASLGCRLSDHGLERLSAVPFTDAEVDRIFRKRLQGGDVTPAEAEIYQSAILFALGVEYAQRGWTQQFHLGALRNNNNRLLDTLGPDTGFDSIGDFSQAVTLSRFLNRLDQNNQLAKTILYNLNPADNEVFVSMTGNFNDGTIPGKVQWGSAWWFLDQKDGMEKQINALSNFGLLATFVGMLTDSRSFLSFPRHEYFRRILCNLIGRDVQHGELPYDMDLLGQLVRNVCYHNAQSYLNFSTQ